MYVGLKRVPALERLPCTSTNSSLVPGHRAHNSTLYKYTVGRLILANPIQRPQQTHPADSPCFHSTRTRSQALHQEPFPPLRVTRGIHVRRRHHLRLHPGPAPGVRRRLLAGLRSRRRGLPRPARLRRERYALGFYFFLLCFFLGLFRLGSQRVRSIIF